MLEKTSTKYEIQFHFHFAHLGTSLNKKNYFSENAEDFIYGTCRSI